MDITEVSCIILFFCSGLVIADDIEYHLLEEQSPRTFVGNVADDTNLRSTLNVSEFNRLQFEILKEGNPYGEWFSIDTKIGQLETTEVIDRENVCASLQRCILGLDVVIHKEDRDNPLILELFQAFPINIILDDLNDNNPEFPKPELSLTIPESSEVGYVLFISTATDPDSGVNNGVQDYQLVSDDDVFKLQKPGINSGNLGIVVNKNLDREKQSFYRLKVIAKDGGIPQRSGIVMINVTILDTNDNAPIFQQSEYTISIPENQPIGTTVLKVTANDVDINENGKVLYKFSSRVSERVTYSFGINETSGAIKIKNTIDFEKDREFQFVIEAYDRGTSPKTVQALCSITVTDENDNSPQIHINLPPGGSDIPESSEIDRYVAQFEAKDMDSGEGGTVSCTIGSAFFKLQPLSLGMYKIKLARQLDRETTPIHNISITCSDNGQPKNSNTTILVVHVTDANDNFPKFNQTVYNVSIHENNELGDVVALITATDKDSKENGHVTYLIEHDLDGDYFHIDPNSGLLTAAAIFDRELRSHYELKVIGKDSGQTILSTTSTVNIMIADVNDGIPRFSEDRYVFYVQEDVKLGTEVGNITVNDPDIGANGIVSLLQDFAFTDVFVIDSTTGKITTKRGLDREAKAYYIFDLTARDKGNPAHESTTKIEIHVTDINDNPPLIIFPTNSNNSVYVPQLTSIGTVITRIVVSDVDEGVNAEMTYHIIQGDERQIFKINNLTGVMTVDKQIDASDSGTYTLLIAVQDGGVPQLTTWTNLVLIVQDDDGKRNMIIAIAVATVTFALSVAMILTICVIRRRDSMKENEKEMQMKSEKHNFITSWLKCLSASTKDIQRINMSEKVKDTNKQMDFVSGTDRQPMVPDTGSTSSEDSKSIGPSSNQNVTKIDNTTRERSGEMSPRDQDSGERSGEMSPRDQDSGFGESLERRGIQELQGFQHEPNRYTTSYLDSRGIRIPSPYLDTSLPNRCWKKSERPSYNRNLSLDDEVFRGKQKPNVPNFNCRSMSETGENKSNLFTISEQCSNPRSYGFHSLQRNPLNNERSINSKYSFRNSPRRDLPPISATPEPEVLESRDLENIPYKHSTFSLDRYSQSDNNININSRSDTYVSHSPRSDTYVSHSPRSDTYVSHSPRSETYGYCSRSDTYVQSSRSDTYVSNHRSDLNNHDNNGPGSVYLDDIPNRDIVV